MLRLFSLLFLFSTLLFASAKHYDFNLIKKGVDDDNTLLVVGGIQGDEPGGFLSASLLATHYEITKGSVWIVPNLNFYSIIKRSRGPFGDMNRKFAELSCEDPEYDTIQRIKSYIKDEKVKLIVNLHDGSGFYRPTYEDNMHSPSRWGQCSIVDQENIDAQYGNLAEIAHKVNKYVNKHLMKQEHKYHLHNTRTREGDKEMEKSLTYFAINNNKAAFGNEASKSLSTHERVYYHLLALERYMQIMGIEYKRKFTMHPNGVYAAINNDIYISMYDNKIKLPLSKIRNYLRYFPIKKDEEVDFRASNPLLTIVKQGNEYTIQYGNRRLSRLKADYIEHDEHKPTFEFLIDGEVIDVSFGDIVEVKKNFLVKDDQNYRVNVIGYTSSRKKETDVHIAKNQIAQRFSVDQSGDIYRVEYYKKEKFAGMILVKFKS
ncbi:M99 family carboxypeptidase catalytic domain-containing protein [Sulfurimonas sp.]|uniref:M99 family carboxypeptidase catalytic domain-containing protein n=1 Tax=Sulfurimonas sp. TaxID=2022749 RepID=UPI003562A073